MRISLNKMRYIYLTVEINLRIREETFFFYKYETLYQLQYFFTIIVLKRYKSKEMICYGKRLHLTLKCRKIYSNQRYSFIAWPPYLI